MSKEEFIKYVNDNNYAYNETQTQIDISTISDSECQDESITLDKEKRIVILWLDENGSGKAHILNKFELDVLEFFKGWLND